MSRCFPFPPPGYVKKARTNEVDLLKKEKQKEKKHKKDKKDKDKRESKVKKEKEGKEKDGKYKEKDKKEKHREKKKDKDKDKSRDQDKNKVETGGDKGFPGQAERPNASQLPKETKQNDKKGILFENRLTKQYNGNNGEKTRENNHMVDANKDSKFLLELDRRIRDVDGGADTRLVHKFTNSDHRKDEGTVKKIDERGMWADLQPIGNAPIQNHTGNLHPRVDGMPKLLGKYSDRNLEATVEAKEKVKEKKDEGKEKVKEKSEEGNGKVKEKKDEGEGKVKEKKHEGDGKVKEKKDEGKEKAKEKKDDKRGDKRKDKEKEKKGHGKDKDRDKDKKREEKPKERNELKTTEKNKLKEGHKTGPTESNYLTQVNSNSHEIAVSGENLKKRKDFESNGVPRVDNSWPNKCPRPSSSLPPTENGRILEACQISIPNASDRVTKNLKIQNKECKINGIIEAQPSAVPVNKVHTAIVPADPIYDMIEASIIEASTKPPHPDAKYLSKVYSVPKVEQSSDFDDHDWWLGGSVSQDRKPVVESSCVGETPEVWAEAMHIDAADVFALPYVIPY